MPPQNCLRFSYFRSIACHGHALIAASVPPTIWGCACVTGRTPHSPGDTLVDVQAETLVETLLVTLAEAEVETLGDKPVDVEADALAKMLVQSAPKKINRKALKYKLGLALFTWL